MKGRVLSFLVLVLYFTALPILLSEEIRVLPTSLPLPAKLPSSVRIALLTDASMVNISTEGPFYLKLFPDEASIQEKKPLEAVVRPHPDGIKIGGDVYLTNRVLIGVSKGSIKVGKRIYGKKIEIIKKQNNKLLIINELDLDEYIKGVLPLEVHPAWNMEVLKAQAVVSRTFALFKSIEKKGQEYALVDTVQSQVYGGNLFRKPSTDQAVEATKGEILTSGGKLFPAYFHAACGGRTAKADDIWKVEPNPALNGVSCIFCKSSKHWKWALKIPIRVIEQIMQDRGYPAKNLNSLSFAARDHSGRATKIILEYKYSTLTIPADDFRAYLGNDNLKSLKATVFIKEDSAYFVGNGWGHGIGFCQWGGKAQGDQGKNYRQILEYYFPGSKIKKLS